MGTHRGQSKVPGSKGHRRRYGSSTAGSKPQYFQIDGLTPLPPTALHKRAVITGVPLKNAISKL